MSTHNTEPTGGEADAALIQRFKELGIDHTHPAWADDQDLGRSNARVVEDRLLSIERVVEDTGLVPKIIAILNRYRDAAMGRPPGLEDLHHDLLGMAWIRGARTERGPDDFLAGLAAQAMCAQDVISCFNDPEQLGLVLEQYSTASMQRDLNRAPQIVPSPDEPVQGRLYYALPEILAFTDLKALGLVAERPNRRATTPRPSKRAQQLEMDADVQHRVQVARQLGMFAEAVHASLMLAEGLYAQNAAGQNSND